MAQRLNRNHSESVIKRIQTSQLVNRLQDNALGRLKIETGPRKGTPYELSKGQVQSACFLIERTLAKAVLPQDINLNGNLTAVFRDPTQRPAGYARKPVTRD